MIYFLLFLVFWAVCGILTYASWLAYYQRQYPDIASKFIWGDRFSGMFFGLFGPIGLYIMYTESHFRHGFKWW